MNDDNVIELLRAAGTGGTDDIGPAMRKGVRIRRRRRIGQVVGGGVGLAAVVALGVFVSGMGSGPSTVVVAPPATQASPATGASTKSGPLTWAEMKEANIQLLLDTFGSDFVRSGNKDNNQINLDPDSGTAERLPGHKVTVSLQYWDPGLAIGFQGAYEPYELPDGRTVEVDRPGRTIQVFAPGKGARAASTAALYRRPDSSYVRVSVSAQDVETPTAARWQQAVTFLSSYTDTVARLAGSEDVRPRVGEKYVKEKAAPTASDLYLRYLQEALGDAWGTNGDSESRISLKPESELASELPAADYRAKATLQVLTRAQFDAACKTRAGFDGCKASELVLPDGRKLYTFRWADRDETGTMQGDNAVYLERPDGSIVMATVSVNGRNVAAADREAHRTTVLTWFDSLADELVVAVTDKRVGADVFTEK